MDTSTLLELAVNNDKNAEKLLFQHLTDSFRLIAQQKIWNKEFAEEVVQNALTVIYQKYKDIDFKRSFFAWAYKVLENKILDHIKSRQRLKNQPTVLINDDYSYLSWHFDPNLKIRLIECFRELSRVNNKFARILNLKYHGFTTGEICGKMNLSNNNLYTIVSRARSLLEACIRRKEAAI
jgi:RNA polymerase sigma factor (sigma-70 family)